MGWDGIGWDWMAIPNEMQIPILYNVCPSPFASRAPLFVSRMGLKFRHHPAPTVTHRRLLLFFWSFASRPVTEMRLFASRVWVGARWAVCRADNNHHHHGTHVHNHQFRISITILHHHVQCLTKVTRKRFSLHI